MNKNLVFSISRKYLGLMLVVGSLLLIASNNTNYSGAPTTHSGSVVTFLTPKSPDSTNMATGKTSSDVTTTTENSTSGADVSVSSTTAIGLTAPVIDAKTTIEPNKITTAQPTTTSEIYVPPAYDDPELYTPPYSHCGSCRPMYDKTTAQRMCPQYMACMY